MTMFIRLRRGHLKDLETAAIKGKLQHPSRTAPLLSASTNGRIKVGFILLHLCGKSEIGTVVGRPYDGSRQSYKVRERLALLEFYELTSTKCVWIQRSDAEFIKMQSSSFAAHCL